MALVAVASALLFAWGANRLIRRRAERVPIDLTGIEGRIVFFSDAACRRCDAARERLAASGVAFEEVRYGDDPARFRATGTPAVPLVVVRDADGAEVGRIAGEVRAGELQAMLEKAGL